jgi:hypothetical protein
MAKPVVELVYMEPFDSLLLRVDGKVVDEDNVLDAQNVLERLAPLLGFEFTYTHAEKVPKDSGAWYEGCDDEC